MKRMKYLVLLLAIVCGLSACGKKENKPVELSEGEYFLYYTNQSLTKLGTEIYQSEKTEADGVVSLAEELVEALRQPPKNMELLSAIPEEVKVTKMQTNDSGQLLVYFNAAYNGMNSIREIMCRAAVVKTLKQIDGVEFVGFYINDQPLTDVANNAITLMSASSFVESSGDSTAELQRVQLTLYFADESGTSLLETERTVVGSAGISKEQLVIEQLLAGPTEEGRYATLPDTATALSVSVRKGICYVNFDSAFLNDALNVNDYIPIYSIVDSLTELPNVNKVQISVEGVSNIRFRDSISLEKPLERNLEYMENQETGTKSGN